MEIFAALRRTEGPRLRAERCRHERHLGRTDAPLHAFERRTERSQQHVARRHDAAPEHDHLGIEHIDQTGEPRAQRPHRPLPDLPRGTVARAHRRHELAGRLKSPAAARAHRAIADRILQTARRAHDVGGTVGIE